MSGCNSGIYSCGRMLYTLSRNGQAPKFLGRVTKDGVPANAIKATLLCLLICVALNYIYPNSKLFVYIYSASVLPGMVPWIVLCISQIKFRKEHAAQMAMHPFKSKFFPYANYIVVMYLFLVLIGMCFNSETQMSLLIGAVFCVIVTIGYFAFGINKRTAPKAEEFKDMEIRN
jgi:AAT family amino acid transporter